MIDLSSQLSPELMGRISAIMATAPSQRCDEQTLGDYIARLIEHRSVKTEREVAQMDDNDWESMSNSWRQRKTGGVSLAVKDKKAVIRSLIESGKANGKLTTREINDALEQLDFDVEKVDKL